MFGLLRFLLAYLVVISHLVGSDYLAHFGFYAVLGFFVVAGYFMTFCAQRGIPLRRHPVLR